MSYLLDSAMLTGLSHNVELLLPPQKSQEMRLTETFNIRDSRLLQTELKPLSSLTSLQRYNVLQNSHLVLS